MAVRTGGAVVIREPRIIAAFDDPETGFFCRHSETHPDTLAEFPWMGKTRWCVSGDAGSATGLTLAEAYAEYERRYGAVEVRHAA